MTSKPTREGPGSGATGSQADAGVGEDGPARDTEAAWARFGYLGAIFLGPVIPLAVYLTRRRRSPFMRFHAARALNLSLTWVLYGLCCVIAGGLLVLDSLTVALVVVLPVAFALWLAMVNYLIRGVGAANRGERYEVPSWICALIAK
jgi:uncharacterized Tic20 family protein